MATASELAAARYRQVTSVTRSVIELIQQLWQSMSAATIATDLEGEAGAVIVAAVVAGQLTVSQGAQAFVAGAMAEQDSATVPEAVLVAEAFPGIAPDGGPLETLLYLPAVGVQRRLAAGLPPDEAMIGGLADMARYVSTSIADTGRSSVQVGMAADRQCVAYTRVVTLPACSRCIILSGQQYRYSEGFMRHPNCFPAGVKVSGPSARAATRRRYEGELVVLTTASGEELPATGNHPILTDRGWLPANLLEKGDHVVRSTLGQGAVPLVIPNERHMPTLIEDVWRPRSVMSLLQMPTTTEDFHGDGGHGDVDVVLPDGLLGQRLEATFRQPLSELALALGVVTASLLAREGAPLKLLETLFRATDGIVRGASLGSPLGGGHLGGAGQASFGASASRDAMLGKYAADGASAYAEAGGDGVLAFTCGIGGNDLLLGELDAPSPRWDAPGSYRTVEDARGYASRGKDLLARLSGQVELDRLVDVRRVDFSGHVYNLTSAEGWYSANGLIVSNCDCQLVPLREREWGEVPTPRELFDRMPEAERSRVFTVAGAQAIGEGADIGQVVNARRGMTRAGVPTTTEGITRRGLYGRQRRRAGGEFARYPGQRYSQTTTPRLTPEAIFQQASGRDEQLRLLKRYGYIV